MTVDLFDLADALRWALVLSGLVWIFYAWRQRVEYRRAVWVLLGLLAIDWLAHALAGWAEQPDSSIPSEFSIFSIYVVAAAGAGMAAALLYARHIRLSPRAVLDAALVAVIAGGIGARAFQVWMHWDYYSQNTDDILNLRQGGMGLRGGIIAGLVALAIYAIVRGAVVERRRRLAGRRRASFWSLADAGSLALALGQSIGWYGAFLIGVNYGAVSDSPLAQDLPDAYGIVASRIPVQLFAMIFFGVLFLVLAWLGWRQSSPGTLFLTYLLISGIGGIVLGNWRGDETLHWGAWRVDQYVDLAFATIGLIGLGPRAWPARRRLVARSPAEVR